ncbi:hypothetical protein J3459_018448 [Metarhizium acridum]|nr:hypothetical protein J3459_018448 [Metarhizium acridum]
MFLCLSHLAYVHTAGRGIVSSFFGVLFVCRGGGGWLQRLDDMYGVSVRPTPMSWLLKRLRRAFRGRVRSLERQGKKVAGGASPRIPHASDAQHGLHVSKLQRDQPVACIPSSEGCGLVLSLHVVIRFASTNPLGARLENLLALPEATIGLRPAVVP